METLDCIIIGAGPAGLFCGANIQRGRKVLILEKNASAGRKLLLSGGGRCNVTHAGSEEAFLKAYHRAGRFLRFALAAFPNTSLTAFLESRGVKTIARKDGKIFPASMKAGDVLEALLEACIGAGSAVKYKEAVNAVSLDEGLFTSCTKNGAYKSKRLVVAAGGMSFPETGSSGDGFRLAESLGHSIVKPTPALAPLFVDGFSDMAGLVVPNAECRIERNGRLLAKNTGSVLFTHEGISGPGVLDISRCAEEGDVFSMSVVGTEAADMTTEDFHGLFVGEAKSAGGKSAKSFVKKLGVPDALALRILQMSHIEPSLRIGEVSKKQRRLLGNNLFSLKLKIKSKGGFDAAMATAGGVNLREINPRTMESKAAPGLFVIGEALDADGITGGYNLQAAFSTGFLAARAITSQTQA